MVTVTRIAIIKVIELAILCCIIGIHANASKTGTSLEDIFVSAGTEVGYLVIFVGILAGSFMGTPINRRVELFFTLVGCALFIASGAIVIDRWHPVVFKDKYRDMHLARGSLSIIEGAVLLADSFFIFRGES